VWSSWKQDGSREGVYAQLFDGSGRKTSFETQINITTDSYQWEPDFIATGSGEILVVWSSWGQVGDDYEVVARRVVPVRPEGYLRPSGYSHAAGRSTAHILVHVIDTLALTGDSYEATLDSLGGRKTSATIRNISTGDTLVRGFPIDGGEGVFYLTPVFEGVAVEIIPEFDLALDFGGSYFVNHSGTNLALTPSTSAAGAPLMAPIDVALIWGSTDTLLNGTYAAPLDTAIGVNGVRNVVIPFKGWNLTDNQQMQMLILETKANQRWEPGERIVFRTPPQYRKAVNNTHAEIRSSLPAETLVLPAAGDTNYVLTTRPIGPEERYVFTTDKAQLVDVVPQRHLPLTYSLSQNYPNPFNPETNIQYSVPEQARVRLEVYNLLGQNVATLIDEVHAPGSYRAVFDGSGMASGVYFCRLEAGNRTIMQKMLLVR